VTTTDWLIFRGTGEPHDGIERLPAPPPWRSFDGGPVGQVARDRLGRRHALASTYQADPDTVELVNTALYLRRPLLVTGAPGIGKSTLAYAVAHELRLGPVLRWPISSRSTLRDGLYRYDAVGRIEDISAGAAGGNGTDRTGNGARQQEQDPAGDIGRYLRLGPLGTALAPFRLPRVLLVDEIDKSDIDLPNDLLDTFEEGEYEIPELARIADTTAEVAVRPVDSGERIKIRDGRVQCSAFPFVVLTSNQERDFPPAFLRRCVRLDLAAPDHDRLTAIVEAHLGPDLASSHADLVAAFLSRRETGELATDQLLNAVYLLAHAATEERPTRDRLATLVLRRLDPNG
jgi:MoxR-like ATPase